MWCRGVLSLEVAVSWKSDPHNGVTRAMVNHVKKDFVNESTCRELVAFGVVTWLACKASRLEAPLTCGVNFCPTRPRFFHFFFFSSLALDYTIEVGFSLAVTPSFPLIRDNLKLKPLALRRQIISKIRTDSTIERATASILRTEQTRQLSVRLP